MNIEVKNSVKLIDYNESMEFLNKRVQDVILGKKSELVWVLEHKTVYTAGTNSNPNHLINKNIKVIKTNRGGKHTLHAPGQKVIYFVLDLNKREKDIKKLLKKVEKCMIEVLNEYKIKSFSDAKNIGIWVGKKKEPKKVGSIGLRIKRWVAYHGFSLNITNNLDNYKNIKACGNKYKKITNLNKFSKNNYNNIDKIIIKKFLDIFA
jgi:lipoyl(octanoyl) transferase